MNTAGIIASVIGLLIVGLLGGYLRTQRHVREAKKLSEASNAASKRKAGWYKDPFDPTAERYWNGAHWTGEIRKWNPEASPGARGRKGYG